MNFVLLLIKQRALCSSSHSGYSSTTNMTWRAVFLGLLLICVAADATKNSGHMRKPSCPDMDEIMACPMNYAPVCGSNGKTYANECVLCAEKQATKQDILIVKEESCCGEFECN